MAVRNRPNKLKIAGVYAALLAAITPLLYHLHVFSSYVYSPSVVHGKYTLGTGFDPNPSGYVPVGGWGGAFPNTWVLDPWRVYAAVLVVLLVGVGVYVTTRLLSRSDKAVTA